MSRCFQAETTESLQRTECGPCSATKLVSRTIKKNESVLSRNHSCCPAKAGFNVIRHRPQPYSCSLTMTRYKLWPIPLVRGRNQSFTIISLLIRSESSCHGLTRTLCVLPRLPRERKQLLLLMALMGTSSRRSIMMLPTCTFLTIDSGILPILLPNPIC